MTCVNRSLHGGSHAFRDELYHNQWASAFMVVGIVAEAKLVKDHGWKCTAAMVLWIVLRAAARCISISCRVPRLGQGTFRPGGDDGLGGRPAQDRCLSWSGG